AIVATAERLLQLEQLLLDDGVDLRLVAEQRAQLADALLQVAVLVLDVLALERGERAEAQLENRRRLALAQVELLLQPGAGGLGVGSGADQGDQRVEVVERDEQPLQDVRALLRLAELVLRPARDDLALEVDVVADEL